VEGARNEGGRFRGRSEVNGSQTRREFYVENGGSKKWRQQDVEGAKNGGSQKWREPEIEGAKTGGESREKCSENNRAAKTDNNQEGSHKKGTEQQHSRWMIFDQSSSGPDMSGRSSGVVFDSRGSNVVADTGFQGKFASPFISDSPRTLERGTQLSLLAVWKKYHCGSHHLLPHLSG